jgi:ATP-dependent helicase/nuclease subunit A
VAEILRLNGIPAAASENDAFFEQVEILQIIDILKALDNPLVDLPLVGALSGPALGLDEAALARVRMCDREGGWYDALQAAAESGDELGIACRAFLERLANWRVRAAMRPVDETICEICEETAFFSTIGASEGGRARQANIRSLTELAAQYERETGGGLHGFLKAIDRMANEGRQGAAGAADADAVRILTIHASKGLQYPVVILLGMGTRFNREDEHGTMLLNHKQGVAMQIFNAENMTRRIPIFIKAVAAGITRETIEEEARILYVGMTRAQERLLVYGSISNPEKYIGETEDDEDGAIAEYEIVNAVSAIEWIILSLRGRPEMNVIRSALGGMADARGADEGGARLFRVSVHSQRPPGVLIHSRSDADDANADDNFNYDLLTDDMSSGEGGYKFIEIPECESRRYKRSVTEITHAGLSGGELIPERPLFAGAAAAAAEVGSAVHAVLSRLDLARLRSEEHRLVVGDTIRRMVELNLLVGESRIDIDRILKFFEHPLGGRVIWANEIKREWPFNYVPPEEPGTLIQGVIDCCFISGGGWTLIDYKTDRVRVLGELVDRYRAQVELYSRALEAITQRPVLERGIYSFTLGDVIFI